MRIVTLQIACLFLFGSSVLIQASTGPITKVAKISQTSCRKALYGHRFLMDLRLNLPPTLIFPQNFVPKKQNSAVAMFSVIHGCSAKR